MRNISREIVEFIRSVLFAVFDYEEWHSVSLWVLGVKVEIYFCVTNRLYHFTQLNQAAFFAHPKDLPHDVVTLDVYERRSVAISAFLLEPADMSLGLL